MHQIFNSLKAKRQSNRLRPVHRRQRFGRQSGRQRIDTSISNAQGPMASQQVAQGTTGQLSAQD